MILCKYENLPDNMKIPEVKKYYDILNKRKLSLLMKRLFDIVVSLIMLIIVFPILFIVAILIKLDSKGPVFFRQERVTQYGKIFHIFKFRTMVANADKIGTLVTVNNDVRVTKVGRIIRKCKLDELPQLIDVFRGTMTFVGTRPEVVKYVNQYTPEMMATLLLPAGITSLTSIYYCDESTLLDASKNPDKTYVEEVLPDKMKWNLKGVEKFSFWSDIKIMFMTFFVACGKEYDKTIFMNK